MTERELELRRTIMAAFAQTGAPPPVDDEPALRGLAEQHVIVLYERRRGRPRIRMAHPFAAQPGAARVDAGDATWWGNCAWDGVGIAAALGVRDATVTSNGIALRVRDGRVNGRAVFHVAVPARAWWDDIAFT